MATKLIRFLHVFLPAADRFRDLHWQPAVDVYRTRSGWLIKFELAGVRAEEIDLQVLGNRMTIRGKRCDTVLEACHKSGEPPPVHHRMEISYSRFERALELPCDLKRAAITTEYRDGLLLVRINPEQ